MTLIYIITEITEFWLWFIKELWTPSFTLQLHCATFDWKEKKARSMQSRPVFIALIVLLLVTLQECQFL